MSSRRACRSADSSSPLLCAASMARRSSSLVSGDSPPPSSSVGKKIAAVVRNETDDQAYLRLTENLQRDDLTPKEEAAALEVLVRERGWTTRQVGEAVKRDHT